MPTRDLLPGGIDRRDPLEGHHAAHGAAYDLFGNGKTAIKVNVGKYLTAVTASNSDTDLQPRSPHRHQHDADVDRSTQWRNRRRLHPALRPA